MPITGDAAANQVLAMIDLPELNATFETATARVKADELIVGTGRVERRWRWTGHGLVTVGFRDLQSQRQWVDLPPATAADWSVPGTDPSQPANLVSLVAAPGTDDGFTEEHLAVTATVAYPASGVSVRYVIWAYPHAPGLRTQVLVRGPAGAVAPAVNWVDHLPVSSRGLCRRAIGYYNDTQNRHTAETHLLREELVTDATVSWASILCLEDECSGLAMVKESHKCVNQAGVDTGAFIVDETGLANTGLMFGAADLREDRYRAGWASWVVVYGGGADAREWAIKEFDRRRYPVKLERDMYVKANTWGSGNDSRESRDKAMEAEVLREIDSVADLGLDGLQIDDGWQVNREGAGLPADGGIAWRPHPEIYPEGWKNVKTRAAARGVRLGIWAPAEQISLADLEWNHAEAGFWTWKLDFANLSTPDAIERNIEKVRAFIASTGHRVETVWDVTERTARYGYFWAREYGCIWLANRKPDSPASVIAQPWLMLREAWELARYVNLNKFQLPIQNVQRVNREKSDAYRHGHSYAVALGLAGIPVFFQTTYLYEDPARDEIRELLALYKQHREAMFTSYVFPIGDEPSNASWAGFQWVHPHRATGYLLLFRELHNQEPEKRIALRFLAGTTIRVTDLRSQQERMIDVDDDGYGCFSLDRPADFLFGRYETPMTG